MTKGRDDRFFVVIQLVNGGVSEVGVYNETDFDQAVGRAKQVAAESEYTQVPGKLWWSADDAPGFEVMVFDMYNQHTVNIDD